LLVGAAAFFDVVVVLIPYVDAYNNSQSQQQQVGFFCSYLKDKIDHPSSDVNYSVPTLVTDVDVMNVKLYAQDCGGSK
jgi:hypothetical protein